MSNEDGWWGAGYDEAEAEMDKKDRGGDFIFRFWMPVDPNNEVRLTFVDDDTRPSEHLLGKKPPFHFYEHQMYLNGHWRNWYSCLGDDCPLCKAGNKPYYAAVYTVIDHSEWTDKRGTVHKDEKKLYVAKSDVLRTIKRISSKKGGLRGLVVDVSRLANTEANVGGHFDFVEKVQLPTDVQPFEYRNVLARKSAEDLESLVGLQKSEDDEIPF